MLRVGDGLRGERVAAGSWCDGAALAGLGDRVCVCEAAHVVGGAAEEVEAVGDLEAGGAFHFRYQRHCVGGEDGGVFNGLG